MMVVIMIAITVVTLAVVMVLVMMLASYECSLSAWTFWSAKREPLVASYVLAPKRLVSGLP